MRARLRGPIALGVSLAIHVCLLVWMATRPPPPERVAEPVAVAPVVIDLVQISARKPEAEPAPSTGKPATAPGRTAKKTSKRAPPQVAAKPDSPPPAAAPDAPRAGTDERRASAEMPDPSARGKLFPTVPGVSGSGSRWVRTDSGRGRTIRNDPADQPDPDAVAAYQAEQAKSRVDGWINDDLATLRAQNGMVDRYFHEMKNGLERQAANPPPFEGKPFVQHMVNHYVASAQRYGQSGNPYVVPPDPERIEERRTAEAAEKERTRGGGKGSPAEQFHQTLQAGQFLRDYADGKMTAALVAVVEIRQARDGKLLGHVLVESSGNPVFDSHVMKTAPEALSKLPPPPESGAGLHPDGMKSLWAFEGKVVYKKKLKDVKWDESWWYQAAMIPLGLATGSFDEVTGDVYVVDLTDPQFVCKVKLLRVY